MLTTAGCAQPEPDQQQVAEAVGKLPGVVGVDASFVGRSMGGGGDQKIEVDVSPSVTPEQVEALVRDLPKTVKEFKHGGGYDEFVLAIERPGTPESHERDATDASWSSLTYGPQLPASGLARRWADAVATAPGGLQVRSWPSSRPTTAEITTHDPVSASLEWALGTDLTDLDWEIMEFKVPGLPFVRYLPHASLTSGMVEDWKAIEATFPGDTEAGSVARAVVVADFDGVRHAQVTVSFPTVTGPVSEASPGDKVWPLVTAIHDTMPAGLRFDLDLGRAERGEEGRDGDLVDGGTGSADWEAAYRQRFPDAVPVSATPK